MATVQGFLSFPSEGIFTDHLVVDTKCTLCIRHNISLGNSAGFLHYGELSDRLVGDEVWLSPGLPSFWGDIQGFFIWRNIPGRSAGQ